MISRTLVAIPPSCDNRTLPHVAPSTNTTTQGIPHVILHSDESVEGGSLSSATIGSSVHFGDDDPCSGAASTGDDLDRPVSTGDLEKGWSREIHRAFVENIYEMGIRNASPSVLLENMKNESGFVTKERAKSHLQKYRMNKDRSKEDFLADYDAWMSSSQEAISKTRQTITSSDDLSNAVDQRLLGSGEMAAFLSLSCMLDDDVRDDLEVDVKEYSKNVTGLLDLDRSLDIPALTDDEKASPLGKMMLNIMGCFNMIQKRLEEQRRNEALGTETDPDDFTEDCCDIEPVPLSPRKRPMSAGLDYDSLMPMMLMSPPCGLESKQTTQAMPPLHLTPAAAPPPQPQTWRPPVIRGSHPIPYPRPNMPQPRPPDFIPNPYAAHKRARIVGPDPAPPVLSRFHSAPSHHELVQPLPPRRPGGPCTTALLHPYHHPHHTYSSYAGPWHGLPPRQSFVPSVLPHGPPGVAPSLPLPGGFLHHRPTTHAPPSQYFGYNSMGKAVHPK